MGAEEAESEDGEADDLEDEGWGGGDERAGEHKGDGGAEGDAVAEAVGAVAHPGGAEGADEVGEEDYKLPVPAIKNAAGKYVVPSLESTAAAAAGFLAKTPDDLRVNIVNPPEGETAYPIAGYTWILVAKDQKDEAKAQALTDFLYWVLTEGATRLNR